MGGSAKSLLRPPFGKGTLSWGLIPIAENPTRYCMVMHGIADVGEFNDLLRITLLSLKMR